MFILLGIAWLLSTTICLWLVWTIYRLVQAIEKTNSMTVQIMTAEESKEFVTHAKARAWKELYMEVGK